MVQGLALDAGDFVPGESWLFNDHGQNLNIQPIGEKWCKI